MSTAGWIFIVGFRVIDLGALVVWLVWFFRLRDDPDERDDHGHGGGPDLPDGPESGPRGPALDLPLPDAAPWPTRLRDHGGVPAPSARPRQPEPVRPSRAPSRGR